MCRGVFSNVQLCPLKSITFCEKTLAANSSVASTFEIAMLKALDRSQRGRAAQPSYRHQPQDVPKASRGVSVSTLLILIKEAGCQISDPLRQSYCNPAMRCLSISCLLVCLFILLWGGETSACSRGDFYSKIFI